jgi:hypothetical protein
VCSGRNLPKFQRKVLSPTSERTSTLTSDIAKPPIYKPTSRTHKHVLSTEIRFYLQHSLTDIVNKPHLLVNFLAIYALLNLLKQQYTLKVYFEINYDCPLHYFSVMLLMPAVFTVLDTDLFISR